MAIYAERYPKFGYIWLHFVSWFASKTSVEDVVSSICATICFIFCLCAISSGDVHFFWPAAIFVALLLYARVSMSNRTTDQAAFGEFYCTKEHLGCPGGITRNALDISWEPGVKTGANGERPYRHVFVERNTNRQVFLRGINVGGGSKQPYGVSSDQPLENVETAEETAPEVTKIGKPAGSATSSTTVLHRNNDKKVLDSPTSSTSATSKNKSNTNVSKSNTSTTTTSPPASPKAQAASDTNLRRRKNKKGKNNKQNAVELTTKDINTSKQPTIGTAGTAAALASPSSPARPQGAQNPNKISFVNRPFPLSEADDHFRRLLALGFTFFRLCITWEAVEPNESGVYDEEYLEYLEKLVSRARDFGISVFIDFHQDVWSRYCGGSGAPKWTLEAVGLAPGKFKECLAAVRHSDFASSSSSSSSYDKFSSGSCSSADDYPKMWWANNHMHLACATMFSLFFAGDDFAPNFRINKKCSKLYANRGDFDTLQVHDAGLVVDGGPGQLPAGSKQEGSKAPSKTNCSTATGNTAKTPESASSSNAGGGRANNLLAAKPTDTDGNDNSLDLIAIDLNDDDEEEEEQMSSKLQLADATQQELSQPQIPPTTGSLMNTQQPFEYGISSEDMPYYLLKNANDVACSPLFSSPEFEKQNFISIQQFLQDHYLACVELVAKQLKHLDNVLGFDTLNEPDYGFIGNKSLESWRGLGGSQDPTGYLLSPVEAMGLGSGCCLAVDYFEGLYKWRKTEEFANPFRKSCWKAGYECIWKQHGVYDICPSSGKPILHKPDYFALNPRTGQPVKVHEDYLLPFWEKVSSVIKDQLGPEVFTFCSPYAGATDMQNHAMAIDLNSSSSSGLAASSSSASTLRSSKCVYAAHYYEGWQLLFHRYHSWFTTHFQNVMRGKGTKLFFGTPEMCARRVGKDIAYVAANGQHLGPAVVGEIGISMEIEGEANRSRCYDRMMRGLEYSGVAGYTLWHYCPEASQQKNDGWNREHLSIFSQDEVLANETAFAGGRALPAIIRPSPFLVAGRIRYFKFNALSKRRQFELEYEEVDSCTTSQTILFVPHYQYSKESVRTRCSDGQFIERDLVAQKFIYVHDSGIPCDKNGKKIHRIQIWHEPA
ncbi:unnamed protein product [Amoebophrya sp. A120]|nr:unnamed protein product [Amoebophrya sp. A120]|eukprot:GSA120T00007771001.1